MWCKFNMRCFHIKRLASIMLVAGMLVMGGFAQSANASLCMDDDEFAELENQVASGNITSIVDMGVLYYTGECELLDYAKAYDLFIKAARKDHPFAQYIVGYMVHLGRGLLPDLMDSVYWLTKSANNEHENARVILGRYADEHTDGMVKIEEILQDVVAKDDITILQERKVTVHEVNPSATYGAAEERDVATVITLPDAYFMLGFMYSTGLGLKQDLGAGVPLLEKAAEAGQVDALFALGTLYAKGEGVDKDMEKAKELWKAAADKGHSIASQTLARENK